MTAPASERPKVFQAFAKVEKQYPRDYRFPYERAKFAAKGTKSAAKGTTSRTKSAAKGTTTRSKSAAKGTRIVPITRQAVIALAVATLLPLSPLLLTVIPAEELATKLLQLVI